MSAPADAPLIVLATDSGLPSGVGEHMLTLARAIGASHRVVLAFPPAGEAAIFLRRARTAGFEAKPIGNEDAFSRWLRDVAATVLHVHAGIGWEGHGLVSSGWMAGVPIIRTEHLPYLLTDEVQKSEHRLGVGMVDRLVFVSEAAALTYHDAGFSEPNAVIVQNGIDRPCPDSASETTRRSLELGEGDFVVITVARFTAQKNYGLLMTAAQRVVEASSQVRFLCVGDGADRNAIEQTVRNAGLAAAVTFLGERDDVPDLLVAADLFVLPSRFEGLPLVVLEAMALGLPVVATRIGGTCEALGDDYPWLVDPEDATSLAATIIEAQRDGEKRNDLGARNRRRFEERFSADRMGREMAAIYQTVVADKACFA